MMEEEEEGSWEASNKDEGELRFKKG